MALPKNVGYGRLADHLLKNLTEDQRRHIDRDVLREALTKVDPVAELTRIAADLDGGSTPAFIRPAARAFYLCAGLVREFGWDIPR